MDPKAKYCLTDSLLVEPLVNRWFAWSTVIAPVPASFHLMQYQIPLLESYLSAPEVHAEAGKNPEFVAGPFVQVPAEKAEEVKKLLDKTRRTLEANLNFCRDVFNFYNRLVNEAHGQGLEPYYSEVPERLRGLVELVYDYYHRPSLRLMESLIYESEYYRPDLQSLRIAKYRSDQSREYFLNTPRVANDAELEWNVPFADSRIDAFFYLALDPQPLGFVRELIGAHTDVSDAQLAEFFSASPVRRWETWNEKAVRVRYFGHACVFVEYGGTSILVDPFIPPQPNAGGIERFSYADLPDHIDYALVTHNHQDHFNTECLLRLRSRIRCLVVPRSFGALYGDISLRLLAQKMGFRNVVELDNFEALSIPGGMITGIPFLGEHSDLLHGKISYVVTAGRRQIMFGADSDCLDQEVYVRVKKHLGPIDTVFLGMESEGAPLSFGYGSLFPQKVRREYDEMRRQHGCDAERGLALLEAVGANRVYNYAMGLEPWTRYILGLELTPDSPQWKESEKLITRVRDSGNVTAKRLFGKEEMILKNEPDEGSLLVRVSDVPRSVKDEEEQFSF